MAVACASAGWLPWYVPSGLHLPHPADYFFVNGQGQAPAPNLKFTVTRVNGGVIPLPAPGGTWTNADQIQGFPFLSGQFSVSWAAAAHPTAALASNASRRQ